MFSELLKRTLLEDRLAGQQLYLQTWLIPQLEQLFKRIRLEPRLMILPCPSPGPLDVELVKCLTEKQLLEALEETSTWSDSLISREEQIQVLKKLQEELAHVEKKLSDKLIRLQEE